MRDIQLHPHKDYEGGRLCSFISAITNLAGTAIQASAAKDAAGLQADAAANSLALQRDIFETSRRDLAPFSQVGLGALNELSRIFLGTDSPTALTNAQNGGLAPPPFDASTLNLERAALERRLELAATPRFRGDSENELGRPSFGARQDAAGANVDIGATRQRIAEIDQQIAQGQGGNALVRGLPQDPNAGFSPGRLNADERQANFFTSPGFTFRQQEEERAVERAAASRGETFSGQTIDELAARAGGRASNEFDKFTNNLLRLAGLGGNATSQGVNLAQNFSQNAGDTLQDQGAARASGVVGQANAFNQGLSNFDFQFGGAGGNPNNFFAGFNEFGLNSSSGLGGSAASSLPAFSNNSVGTSRLAF